MPAAAQVVPTREFETAGESFAWGGEVLVLGMGAVFLGLMAVYSFLVLLRRITASRPQRGEAPAEAAVSAAPPAEVSTEVAHAIALALYMDLRTFDEATAAEITIRKISRPFSPWWNAGKAQIMHDKIDIYRKHG